MCFVFVKNKPKQVCSDEIKSLCQFSDLLNHAISFLTPAQTERQTKRGDGWVGGWARISLEPSEPSQWRNQRDAQHVMDKTSHAVYPQNMTFWNCAYDRLAQSPPQTFPCLCLINLFFLKKSTVSISSPPPGDTVPCY